MVRLYLSLLFLGAIMVLVSRDIHPWAWKKVVREYEDIPETYVYVQQALWFAMKEYNKASKDKYTFKVVKVLKSQEQLQVLTKTLNGGQWWALHREGAQEVRNFGGYIIWDTVTDSLDYFLEVKIGRTMCKKALGENENCLLQQDPKMRKMLHCTFIVITKPWIFELALQKKHCKDV